MKTVTPIIVPLSESSQWGLHNEMKYLIRSAVKHIEFPWVIIVGHLPGWAAVEKDTTHQNNQGRLTHISCEDDGQRSKDYNMAVKIRKGCEFLFMENHRGGLIRASDDQLFLKPYRPTVWHGLTIYEYLDRDRQMRKRRKNASPLQSAFNIRLKKMLTYWTDEFENPALLNFEVHNPQWYLSAKSYMDSFDKFEYLFKQDAATVNTLYYNTPEVFRELIKNKKELLRHQTRDRAVKIISALDREFIMEFAQTYGEHSQVEVMGYSPSTTQGARGVNFTGWVESRFSDKTNFEKD